MISWGNKVYKEKSKDTNALTKFNEYMCRRMITPLIYELCLVTCLFVFLFFCFLSRSKWRTTKVTRIQVFPIHIRCIHLLICNISRSRQIPIRPATLTSTLSTLETKSVLLISKLYILRKISLNYKCAA